MVAAALATIDYIEEAKIMANVTKLGDYLRGEMLAMQKEFKCIGDVRGMGLMIGVELVSDRKTKAPDAKAVVKIFEETKKDGLLIGKGGLYGNVLRISPPMNVTKAEIDEALKKLHKAFKTI